MTERNFDKLGNIQSAVDTLRRYNQYVLFPVNESVFNNSALEEYFDSPLGSPIERNVEKIVCVAGIRAVYENSNIPTINKDRAARNTARDLREAMRCAKLEYHLEAKGLTYKEYRKGKRGLSIVSRRMKVQMAKKMAKNVAITTIATVVAGPVGGVITGGGRLLWAFMPEKIKGQIQKGAKEIKEEAINVLQNSIVDVKSTSAGQSLQKVIDAVKPTLRAAADTGRKLYNKGKDFVKSYWPF